MAELRTSSAKMSLVYVPRNQIKFWAGNPRRNDKAAPRLAELIRKNGMKSPLVLWKKNMVVYKGNTTLKALDLLNEGKNYEVPCLLQDFKDEAAAVAYGLSDNKASEFAEWDEDILADMLASKSLKPNLEATGFQTKEIANLLWLPDDSRLDKVTDTDEGMSAKIQIFCQSEDKEAVMEILRSWAEDSGFENVVVK